MLDYILRGQGWPIAGDSVASGGDSIRFITAIHLLSLQLLPQNRRHHYS